MAQDIKPTRSELLKIKKQIRLAKSGHSLLKKRRDGLILAFFDILKKAKNVRQELSADYAKALQRINIARTVEGDIKIKSIALSVQKLPDVNLGIKNIMGVRVPKVDFQMKEEQKDAAVYKSASVDEAAKSYEELMKKIIVAAEVESSIRKLLSEIEKTKRRVNALEFKVLPRLNKTKSIIQIRLEEMERDSIFGMKLIKNREKSG